MSPTPRAFLLAQLLSRSGTRDMPSGGNVAWRADGLPAAGYSLLALQRTAAPRRHAGFPRVGIRWARYGTDVGGIAICLRSHHATPNADVESLSAPSAEPGAWRTRASVAAMRAFACCRAVRSSAARRANRSRTSGLTSHAVGGRAGFSCGSAFNQPIVSSDCMTLSSSWRCSGAFSGP